MKIFAFALVLVVLATDVVMSQTDPVLKFAPRSFSFQGHVLPYRIFIPDNYQPAGNYPLLLALHGSGERGTDNTAQLRANRMATAWVDAAVQAKSPCFVVAPQCPPGVDWGYEIGTLISLLDSLSMEFSLDSNRIYITGLSMGAYGLWNMITTYPRRFAAAIPMSGGWDSSRAYIVKDMPIWDFHGAADESVPVSESRKMITAMESLGRTTVYTDCHGFDCAGMPDSLLAMFVQSHADLLYTEYQGGGHVIWDEAYTTPLLSTWLFDQYRQTDSAIQLSNLRSYQTISALKTILWSGGTPDDSIEIWESPDAGGYWHLVARSTPNSGSYDWNTFLVPDRAFGLLKIFLKDKLGHIYGHHQSGYFAVDNPDNGVPFVKVSTPGVEPGQMLIADSLILRLLVGDPEASNLTVRILYSADAGKTFSIADTFSAVSDTNDVTRQLNIGQLANSQNCVIAVEVSDGTLTGRTALPSSVKQTPRSQSPPVSHTAGSGGSVTVHVVNSRQLTGHLYRVTFHGVTFGEKSYDVVDLDRGQVVVQGGFPLDGVTEGPMFDGVRLVVRDVADAALDAAGTKWEVGAPTLLNVAVYLPTIVLDTGTIHGYPQAADYAITFADHLVDTSSSAVVGVPEVPVTFAVTNLTENRRSEFIYVDADNNGFISGNDEVYILEPDSLSNLRITWELQFVSQTGRTLPQPGDRFVLKTIKPISTQDVFEFRTTSNSVKPGSLPERTILFANFPNPFNPVTTIHYTIGGTGDHQTANRLAGGSGTSKTILVVYDLLGREVAVLVNEQKVPGSYAVRFDGSNLASGVYFYRLTVGSFAEAKKMVLVK